MYNKSNWENEGQSLNIVKSNQKNLKYLIKNIIDNIDTEIQDNKIKLEKLHEYITLTFPQENINEDELNKI